MSLLKKFFNMARSRGTTAADKWIERNRDAVAELRTCDRDIKKRQLKLYERYEESSARSLKLDKQMDKTRQQIESFHGAARQAKKDGNLDIAREQLRLEIQFKQLLDDLDSAKDANVGTQTALKEAWQKMESRRTQIHGEIELLAAREGMIEAGDMGDWADSDDLLDSVSQTIQDARDVVDTAEIHQSARRSTREAFKKPSKSEVRDPDVEELLNSL